MPEIPQSQSEDPLPKKPDTLHKRVTEFHAENPRNGSLAELVVLDDRDPFSWKARQENTVDVNYSLARSEQLRHLMWAAYRVMGTLPSEDASPKIRDTERFSPEIEQRLLDALSDNDRKVLKNYHDFLIASVADSDSLPPMKTAEMPVVQMSERSKKEEMLAAILEHMDIVKLQKETTDGSSNTSNIDT